MTMLRWWLVGVSVGAMTSGGGCSREDTARKASLRRNLSTIAARVEARPHPRVMRRDAPAMPGTFGDAFTAREAERKALEGANDTAARCAKRSAQEDAGANDDAERQRCVSDLRATRAALETILDLGRTERAGAPAAANPLAPMNAPLIAKSLLATCNHSTAHAMTALEGGRPEEAARLCTQTLEVARDYAAGANLVGAVTVATCIEKLEPPCKRALGTLTNAEVRSKARQDLQVVADSLPPFVEFAEAELVAVHLPLCGNYLEPAERAQLGPLGRAVVDTADAQYRALPSGELSMHLTLCLEGVEAADVAARAYREPSGSAARARLLEEHEKKKQKQTLTGANMGPYADKYEGGIAKVRALAR